MRGKIFLMLVGLIFFVGVSRGDGRSAGNSHSDLPPTQAWPYSDLLSLPPNGGGKLFQILQSFLKSSDIGTENIFKSTSKAGANVNEQRLGKRN